LLEVEDPQRQREMDDLAFQLPENQWDAAAKQARQATIVGGIAVPARPMISIPKLDQPIGSVLNQEKAAHLGVTVHPLTEDADDDTAEVQRDLYRMIERQSRAGLARSWAFDRAVKAGRGGYRVLTAWDDESDNPTDQKIVIKRVLRQEMLFFDTMGSEEPDFCDGEWGAIGSWLPWETYKRQYRETTLADYDDDALSALMHDEPLWVRGDGEKRAVFVLEYFRKVHTTEPLSVTNAADGQPVTRARDVVTVEWYKLNAVEVLAKEDWNGKYIPLIPTLGRELQPFDQERRWIGMVRPNRDSAKLFNAAASNALETAATEPKPKYLMYSGQQEGHETAWQQANIRNFPYLLVNPVVDAATGRVLPLPQLTQADTSKLQMSLQLLEQAERFIQAGTSNTDPTMLEQLARKKVAHQTLTGLQEQGDLGKSDFLHTLAEVTLTYEAKVVLDLMPSIYDRPGRVVRLLDLQDNPKTIMLNQPFTIDPQTKRPVPVNGQPPPHGMNGQPAPKVLNFDLRKGRYGSSVSIGKSFQSRLEEGATEIGGILQADPALMPLIGPTYFKFRDFPGSKEIAELLKKLRAKTYPGLDTEEGAQEDAQQQLEAAKGQIQQMSEVLQQAQQFVATEQAKHQAQVQIAQAKEQASVELAAIQAQTDIKLQEMKNAATIAVAEINAQTKGVTALLDAEHERMALHETQQHEARQAGAGRTHERTMGQEGHAQGLEAQRDQQGAQADEAERGRQAAAEEAELTRQAAAAEPVA
jgi:hypothetical protein